MKIKILTGMLFVFFLSGCGRLAAPEPSATPIPTRTPQPTATMVPTATPTETPEPTPTLIERYQKEGDYLHSVEVNEEERWFTVHIPTGYQPGDVVPLVLNFHGRTSNAFEQEEISAMYAKGDAEGFVVVNPQALDDPPTWWGAIPNEVGDDDFAFIQTLLDELRLHIRIDPARIYATGLSNGGSMVTRLGCDLSNQIAAVAPVSGGHVGRELCEPLRPVPMVVFHGVRDTIIPYEGIEAQFEGDRALPSVREWVTDWAFRNGCDLTPVKSQASETILKELWTNCDEGADVILYSMEEAGHTWPGAVFGVTWGGMTDEINATDLIWEFFMEHPKPAEGDESW